VPGMQSGHSDTNPIIVAAFNGGTMTVWQVGTSGWTLVETIRVPIRYGSSG
jgi:hypothetical protein